MEDNDKLQSKVSLCEVRHQTRKINTGSCVCSRSSSTEQLYSSRNKKFRAEVPPKQTSSATKLVFLILRLGN